MAGHFELFTDDRSRIRFSLVAPDRTVLAVSVPFRDKNTAVAAISDAREHAGLGFIEDHCTAARPRIPAARFRLYHPGNRTIRRRAGRERTKDIHAPKPAPDTVDTASEHVGDVLADLAVLAEASLSPSCPGVSCTITVTRPKRPPASAGSGPLVRELHELLDRVAEGPGATAMTEQHSVLVPDMLADHRWPRWARSAAGRNIRSVLCIPLAVEGQAQAMLTLAMKDPDSFTSDAVRNAEKFAEQATKLIRPPLRIAELKDIVENLHAALEHRTVIDTALGVVMAQNHCDHDTAFGILRRASSTRNQKLRDVAASVVASVSREQLPVHFDP
jgi:hypothetical protein